MGFIRKNKGSLVRLDSSIYVGEKGYLFWDIDTGCSRLSDGKTPGGLSIANCYGGGGPGDAVWGSITGILSDQTDLQDALNLKANQTDLALLDVRVTTNTTDILDLQLNKEDSLGNPTVDGYVLSSLINGTRSWIPQAGGSLLPPVTPIPPTDGEIVDEVIASENLGIKWIYTLQDSVSGEVLSAEILANHQSGTDVRFTRSSIIGARILHTVDVVLDVPNDLLQLQITNLSPDAFIVNVARIKITS